LVEGERGDRFDVVGDGLEAGVSLLVEVRELRVGLGEHLHGSGEVLPLLLHVVWGGVGHLRVRRGEVLDALSVSGLGDLLECLEVVADAFGGRTVVTAAPASSEGGDDDCGNGNSGAPEGCLYRHHKPSSMSHSSWTFSSSGAGSIVCMSDSVSSSM